MTNQQPIKPMLPIFRAERNASINGKPEIFTGDSMELTENGTLIVHNSKTKAWRYCKKETLQISLDGENFYSMEFVNEAIESKEYIEKENKKLKMMIDNGLGWEDMINDITYPVE